MTGRKHIVGPTNTKVLMNDAWKNHIQPILDNWQWDHFSWIYEPFLKYYPTFGEDQRIGVEDALVITASDLSDEKLAIKAISIAETLFTSHLASQRLCDLMKNCLREQVRTLDVNSLITYYYVVSSSFFGVEEAIHPIKSLIEQLRNIEASNRLDERIGNSHSYRELLQACSSALLRLEPYHPNIVRLFPE